MQLLKDLFRKKTVGGICLVILILFLFLAIFADVIAPTPMVNGTLPIDLTAARMPPFQSWEHPLGTDTMGQDLLSYMIYGARTSVILCELHRAVYSHLCGDWRTVRSDRRLV